MPGCLKGGDEMAVRDCYENQEAGFAVERGSNG
jgi:hypothetical protein